MNILDFKKQSETKHKISVVTCYDYSSALIVNETEVDCILVGDSVAMVMHGYKDTLSATIEMMSMHTAAVSRGAPSKFIIADLPFLSYRKSIERSVDAAHQLMMAGAHAVKLEGALGNEQLIRHLSESGVPVMGHLGLTPQFIHMFGGYKVQGKTDQAAKRIFDQAQLLQQAGCFAQVLECVPTLLAKRITEALDIPTIGIGAGKYTDGQVLVYQDLLGINDAFKPKFVKHFLNGFEHIKNSINTYVEEITSEEFPGYEHSYEIE